MREDDLVLDGGESDQGRGAIDARGAASLSRWNCLYERGSSAAIG